MVDSTVLLTRGGCTLGFGGMILGDYDQVTTVARALDIEGKHPAGGVDPECWRPPPVRLLFLSSVPEALGIVISQDGNARFIKSKDGQVIY